MIAAFARTVEANPSKQIVLVLNRAGWHSTKRLRVPDHLHLLFLPPYSPELQPSEHVWQLTNTVLANRHFASIEELEDTQATPVCRPAGPPRYGALQVARQAGLLLPARLQN